MPRYTTRAARPKAWEDDCDWYPNPLLTNIDVVESEPRPTGLLDAEGNEIWRMNDPIGFVHHE